MQEMQSYKVQAQIAQDTSVRAIGMHQGSFLALKAKVVEHDDEQDHTETVILTPEEIKTTHRDFVALAAARHPLVSHSSWTFHYVLS